MKWWPSVVAAVLALLGVFADPVQAWISAHPAVTAGLAGIGTIVAHLLKSPTQQ